MKQFRFNYSEKFTQVLEDFAKSHSTEDRKEFRQSWISLRNKNTEIFQEEICRIQRQGYDGDIDKKIFESIRYYYRKKILKQPTKTSKTSKTSKPKLGGFSREIKQWMDIHIKNIIVQETENLVSPAEAFDDFCRENREEITKEVFRLKSKVNKQVNKQLDPAEITDKFKKSYKNRYYKLHETNKLDK